MAEVNIRAPGVYIERAEKIDRSLGLGKSGVPAFLGLTRRGPLNELCRVTNYKHFLKEFGEPIEGYYLHDAVKGFFENKGEECFILRIAHWYARGRGQVARCSQFTVCSKGDVNRELFVVKSKNEGRWGNDVKFFLSLSKPSYQTFLTLDLDPRKTQAKVRSTRGLKVGSLIRFFDGKREHFVTLTKVSGQEIAWRSEDATVSKFRSASPTYIEPIEFSIVVEWRDKREEFKNLSLSPISKRYFVRYLNQHSEMIKIESNIKGIPKLPEDLPRNVSGVYLNGGHDGLQGVLPQDFIGYNNGPGHRFGMGVLEVEDSIDMVAIPDLYPALRYPKKRQSKREIEAVHRAMIDHCERMKNRIAFIDLPQTATYEEALRWRTNFDSAFGVMYYPWFVVHRGSESKSVPPCGHIAGVIARSDREFGVHKSPANEIVEDVFDLDVLLFDEDVGYLNSKGINCIKYFPTEGIRVWGAKTLSSDPDWSYLNVRRVFSAVGQALREGTEWVVFEPNNHGLWKTIEMQVSYFLLDLFRKGYFKGRTPEESFYVKCDNETNSMDSIDAGMMQADIGLAVVKPAEYIMIKLEQKTEDRSTTNVP